MSRFYIQTKHFIFAVKGIDISQNVFNNTIHSLDKENKTFKNDFFMQYLMIFSLF